MRAHLFHPLAMALLLLTSCTASKVSSLRDVPVSEITLAEPQIAEPKLVAQIKRLQADATKKQELACAIAELSLIHSKMGRTGDASKESKQADKLIDSRDVTSRAYFLTTRARAFVLLSGGKSGSEVSEMLEPLEQGGHLSDLDKAQIEDDMAQFAATDPADTNVYDSASWYGSTALGLRANAAGPHSLEVAESLCTLGSLAADSLAKDLCTKLQLPAIVSKSDGDDERTSSEVRAVIFLERAVKIRQDILGSTSPQVAAALTELADAYADRDGEQSKKSSDALLQAASIYEQRYGPNSSQATSTYAALAAHTENPMKAKEYAKKASVAAALQDAGSDPFKQTYVFLKSTMPEKDLQNRDDFLTKAFTGLGANPPEIKEQEPPTKAAAPVTEFEIEDAKKLSVPQIDKLTGEQTGDYQLTVLGFKNGRKTCHLILPSCGSPRNEVKVIGKDRILFHQDGADGQGYSETEYKWNGKKFVEDGAKSGDQQEEAVKEAIDEAVDGTEIECVAAINMQMHVEHDRILDALKRGHDAAQELFEAGHPKLAAERLHVMFASTFFLVSDAALDDQLNSNDEAKKWIQAWSYDSERVTIKLTPQEWGPYLNDYAYYCQQAGDQKTARHVLQLVLKYLPNRAVAVLNLADAEYALKHIDKARTLYQKYLALAKAQHIKNISQKANERLRSGV